MDEISGTCRSPDDHYRVARPRAVMLLAAVMAIGLTALGGCASSRGGPVAYDRTDFVAPDLPRQVSNADDHLLQSGDIVTVNVFQVDTMSGDKQVDLSGQVEMPLIGGVPAQGLTVKQLAASLTTRLNATYLRDPQVQVLLKTMQPQTVTVDGSVKQAGIYPIAGNTTLLQALALARGLDVGANAKRVVVFRQINGERQAAAFDLSAIRAGQDADPQVHGNDVIVVDGSGSRQMFRDFLMTVPLLAVFTRF